jgi:hypothetical protein
MPSPAAASAGLALLAVPRRNAERILRLARCGAGARSVPHPSPGKSGCITNAHPSPRTIHGGDESGGGGLAGQVQQRRRLKRERHCGVPPDQVPKQRRVLTQQLLLGPPQPALARQQRRLGPTHTNGRRTISLSRTRTRTHACTETRTRTTYVNLAGKGGGLEQRHFVHAFLGHVRERPALYPASQRIRGRTALGGVVKAVSSGELGVARHRNDGCVQQGRSAERRGVIARAGAAHGGRGASCPHRHLL